MIKNFLILLAGFQKYLTGFFVFLCLILKHRNMKLVMVFSDRFGHLYANTEIYLRENPIDFNYIFFCSSKIIDNIELMRLFEKNANIIIYNYYVGRFLKLYCLFSGEKIENLVPKNEPLNYSNFYKNRCIRLTNSLENRNNRYVTMSLRNSKYHEKYQGASSETSDAFRNTSFINVLPLIDYLGEKGYKIYLVNKPCVDYTHPNLEIKSNIPLSETLDLISGADFHIGTSTGIDLIPIMSGKHVLQLNSFFGCSLNSKCYINKSIVLPMKILNSAESRYLNVSEMISLLLDIEKITNKSQIYNKDLFSDRSLLYVQNSSNEILAAAGELLDIIESNCDNHHKNNHNQIRFWENYPKFWVNKTNPDVVFHDEKFPHNCIISNNFLKDHM